jgi:23S rRNA (guanosine2251-2'-O)-methyltransferase
MKPPHGNQPGGAGRSDHGRDRQRPARGWSTQSSPGPAKEHRPRSPEQHRAPQQPGGPLTLTARSGETGQRPRDLSQGQKPYQGNGPQHSKLRHGGNVAHGTQRHSRPSLDVPKGAVWLYGHHAVAAALVNPARRLRRLLLTEEAEAVLTARLPPPWPLSAERADRGRLDHLLGRDIAHQGVALLADPLAPPSLQHALERPGPLVVMDQVTDPRNIGAILRSAAAFGAAAVITQDRNAPEENGTIAKAASGALETIPLLRAVNITRTLIALKAANIWCVGLDADGAPLSGPALSDRRIALVLGAEGDGLRRLTRETCDFIAGLPIKGGMESLNVSAAAAVALYELTRSP